MTVRRSLALLALGVGLMILVTSALVVLSRGAGGRVPRRAVLTVTLGDDLPEESPSSFLGRILSGEHRTYGDLVELFHRAALDRRVEAIVARITPSDLGWARIQELRDAMRDFSNHGKILACHAELLDTPSYFLGAACDTLDQPPTGAFSVPGVAVEVEFYRGLLGKVGVEADMEHIGEYKSASEPLTRESPSPPAREQIESMLDETFNAIVAGVAEDRGLEARKVRGLLDRGLLTPDQAVDDGLVDDLRYYDEVLDDVKDQVGSNAEEVDEADYLRQVRVGRQVGRDRIAVVYATGMIVGGESGQNGLLGQLLGSETVIQVLQDLRDESSVKAVVLRIDSPGGSGSASDAIWRETQRLREEKPLVVSMGDVAASGGYWIAMGADAIVAEPLTVTGSIGVVGGKFVLKPFYDWIGLSKATLKRGRNADLYSDTTRFTPEQRLLVRESMLALYHEFLSRASDGRNRTEAEIDAVARGRVWTGEQARQRGLVDEIGGLETAIARARKLAKIPEGRPVRIDLYPRAKGWLESLASLEDARTLGARSPESLLGVPVVDRLARERVLALMPFRLAPR